MPGSKSARKTASRGRKTDATPARSSPAPHAPEKALEEFGSAMKLFQKRDYARARDQFRDLAEKYPMEYELIDRARGLMAVCEKQTNTESLRPAGPEEQCTQGIIHLNAGELEEALDLFRRAAETGGGGQAWYLLACALAQSARPDESIEALGKAVSADPSNRSRAANEKDFEPLRDKPGYEEIVAGARRAGR